MLYTVGADAAQSSCIPLKAQLVQLLGFNRLAEAGVVLKELRHPLPLDIFLHNISLSSLTSAQDTFYGHKPLLFFFLDRFLICGQRGFSGGIWDARCASTPAHTIATRLPLPAALHALSRSCWTVSPLRIRPWSIHPSDPSAQNNVWHVGTV